MLNQALTNKMVCKAWKFHSSYDRIAASQKHALLMIFATYLITAICFPSIIVYKPLPGDYFENPSNDYTFTRIDMMGVINVGSFFVSSGIGSIVAHRYTKRDSI